MENKKQYTFYIHNHQYHCNRLRVASWLMNHGVQPIRTFFDDMYRCHWIFQVDKAVCELLNEYSVLENSGVLYVIPERE